MKKTLCVFLAIMLLLSVSSCATVSDEGDTAVLPPSRMGTDGTISTSLEQYYTFETAYYASDLVAHVRIGNWLGEDDEACVTYYEATIINNYKGSEGKSIVLLQDGCSNRTLKAYPVFTSGNELLVFMKNAIETEYENAFWILGSYTTILDAVASNSGDLYYMDRYGILGETMDISANYASQYSLSKELYNNAVAMDSIVGNMRFTYPYIFSKSDVEELVAKYQ